MSICWTYRQSERLTRPELSSPSRPDGDLRGRRQRDAAGESSQRNGLKIQIGWIKFAYGGQALPIEDGDAAPFETDQPLLT